MACAVLESKVEYEWKDSETMCIRTTTINKDGVAGNPLSEMVMPVKCCLYGTMAEPDDTELTKACAHVESVASRVTYTWDNSGNVCTESTIVAISGVDDDPVNKSVNKDLCCISGTEAKP